MRAIVKRPVGVGLASQGLSRIDTAWQSAPLKAALKTIKSDSLDCNTFVVAQQSSHELFLAFDNSFSSLLPFGVNSNETGEVIIERAYHLLSRLPVESLSLEMVNSEFLYK